MNESLIDERRHGLFAEVFVLVERSLSGADCLPTLAVLAAGAVADMLADHWGGQTISFSMPCGGMITTASMPRWQS